METEGELQSAQLVLDGNFNPYLISPKWLEEQNIWSGTNVRLALGSIEDGVRFQDESTEWLVDSSQLMISSVENSCGGLASEVLKRLPHTPIRSVRADFVYHSASSETWKLIFEPLKSSPLSQLTPDLLTTGVIFHQRNVRKQVRLVEGDQGVTISVHIFRQTDDVKAAISAAVAFDDDKKESLQILKMLKGGSNG